MKRKTAAFILAICLLLVCVMPQTTASAAGGLCFIACNDTLLTLDSMPYFGGQTYVPYWVFSNYGIYYSYFDSSQTATAFSSSRQVYFNAENGVAYDDDENAYYAPIVFRGSGAYLPLDFMCSYFGLAWSYITGNGYGDVVRIKDSSVSLTDSQFLNAASTLMQQRYNAYYGIAEETPGAPAPTPMPTNREDVMVYLSFTGTPGEKLLSELESRDMKACFFLTGDEIASSPDMVRRIYGGGHGVGLLCQGADSLDSAARALYEAAHRRSFLASGDGFRELIEKSGLVYCGYSISDMDDSGARVSAGSITSQLDKAAGRAVLRMECCDETDAALPEILNYLKANKFTIGVINETFVNGDASND